MIKCAAINKIFKDFWMRPRVRAVTDVNLEILEGEVFGLLGPNGSGKSTTIKMILGLLHPTSGRIAVLGKRPEDVNTKKDIGYLPEESYLYRFLNARETLDYYGRLFHQPRHTRRSRIDMLLEMVGLEAAQHRPVGEYSKGMQRRIGIAQALINDPKLLILDEPTTGMDPIGTRQIKDLLIELRKRGKTILLCSHLLADVEDVCDRVSIMFGGKVVANGTLDELLVDQNTTTLQTENLDDATIKQIESVLKQHGQRIDKVSRPRQSLEHKFLELVHQEQAKGSQTSGAKSGGKIAGFLMDDRSGHMPEDVEAAALLNKLTVPATGTPAETAAETAAGKSGAAKSASTTSPAAKAAPPPADSADESILAELSQPKAEPAEHVKSAQASAGKPTSPDDRNDEDDEIDLSVLDQLVGATDEPAPASNDSRDEMQATEDTVVTDNTDVASNDAATNDTTTNDTAASEMDDADDDSAAASQPTTAATADPDVEPDIDPEIEPDIAAVDEPEMEQQQEHPPAPLVSERTGESGLNLSDAVKVDEDGYEIIEERADLNTATPANLDEPEQREERVSDSGERPDQSFIEALQDIDQHTKKHTKKRPGGSSDA